MIEITQFIARLPDSAVRLAAKPDPWFAAEEAATEAGLAAVFTGANRAHIAGMPYFDVVLRS